MALDDATTALLAQLSMARPKPLHEMTPAEAREMSAAMRAQQGPGPEMARVKNTRVKAAGGAFPVRVLVPAEHPRGVVVYYHGGGWVLGGIEDSDLVGRHLAQRTGCAVVLVGYRLAPEYRYPTPVEDSWAALCWADRAPAWPGGREGAADRGRRQRGRQPGCRGGPARGPRRRPADRAAGADLPGDRLRPGCTCPTRTRRTSCC